MAGVASYAVGHELLEQSQSGKAAIVRIDIRLQRKSDVDYNLIADSPFGDPHHLVVLDAHLDAIYGAGILDNASGSTTILEVALNMAKTPTRNRLRYMWFGGEELGLLGSRYYTTHLTQQALHDIAFDIDTDVTATPNFDILIADPRFASKVKLFPPNVVPQSKVGNALFTDFFKAGGIVSRCGPFRQRWNRLALLQSRRRPEYRHSHATGLLQARLGDAVVGRLSRQLRGRDPEL